MRIVVHDFSGHPFPVQLSRELARRGHHVLHLHCPSYLSGKGALEQHPDDPETFAAEGVPLDRTFEKYAPVRRYLHERDYAKRLADRLAAARPDVVLSGNTPLFAQRALLRTCKRRGIPFVFWQQDIYSLGMKDEVERRWPLVGAVAGRSFVRLEHDLLASSNAVICISDAFRDALVEWGIPRDRIEVIENWAPIDELPALPRDNAWAREHGLEGERVLLYAGTLGRKHDPSLFLALARGVPARIVVVSDGVVADRLRSAGLENLVVLPFQPYERLPEVLASADVLIALLEPDAGRFAVPSKVLTYLCAGRPLLAAMPAENRASQIVLESDSGLLVDPDDEEAVVTAARRLIEDEELRARLSAKARAYAESAFDIEAIGGRFESALLAAVSGRGTDGLDRELVADSAGERVRST